MSCLSVKGQDKSLELVLTNENVIEMFNANLPKDVILAKIRVSKHNFDTSINSLKKLNNANVPKEIISEMIISGKKNLPIQLNIQIKILNLARFQNLKASLKLFLL